MRGLQEAVDDASGEKKLKRNHVVVIPVKQYTADEVKITRKSTGMSQRVFAEYVGVSDKTAEAWEAGKNHPSGSASRLLNMIETKTLFGNILLFGLMHSALADFHINRNKALL